MPLDIVQDQTVPDVSNMTTAEVIAAITAIPDCVPEFPDPIISLTVAAGRAISQSPAAGTNITGPLTVIVQMSSGDGSYWHLKRVRKIGV